MFKFVLSHGVLPQPFGGPVEVPAKYAVELSMMSVMLMPIALTGCLTICANSGISPVVSVVSVMFACRTW
jgi:hypothetical protein